MAIPLKYATASQEIPLGYFLDSSDGNTEETGLTIANTDIKLWKSGATTLANKNSGGATHISNGIYYCTLDATDTNTYGSLIVFVHVSGALAIRVECVVMEADAYDALYAAAGTGHIEADTVQISGDATAANNAESFFDGTGYAGTNNVIPTVTTLTGHTAQTGDNYARLGAPAGASIAADIAAIEAQTDDIGAAGAGLSAVPWNAAWDAEVQSEVQDAIEANKLDHLVAVAESDDPVDNSIIAKMAASDSDWSGFSAATDSLEALRDNQPGTATAIADEVLKRDWNSVSGEAARSALNALRFLRNKWSISGGTLTVTEEDDTSTAWTATVTDDAAADNITAVDPA